MTNTQRRTAAIAALAAITAGTFVLTTHDPGPTASTRQVAAETPMGNPSHSGTAPEPTLTIAEREANAKAQAEADALVACDAQRTAGTIADLRCLSDDELISAGRAIARTPNLNGRASAVAEAIGVTLILGDRLVGMSEWQMDEDSRLVGIGLDAERSAR